MMMRRPWAKKISTHVVAIAFILSVLCTYVFDVPRHLDFTRERTNADVRGGNVYPVYEYVSSLLSASSASSVVSLRRDVETRGRKTYVVSDYFPSLFSASSFISLRTTPSNEKEKPFERFGCAEPRIRKDYRDLTLEERALYHEAVNALKDSGIYDNFVRVHAHPINKAVAHGTSMFLPWHREYLRIFEDTLRSLDSKYACLTIPYWDWAQDASICGDSGCERLDSRSRVLKDFGGPGGSKKFGKGARQKSGTGCIVRGPYRGWLEVDGHCVSRGRSDGWTETKKFFVGRQRLIEIIARNKEYGTRGGFRMYIEGTPHAVAHNILLGTMRSFTSPADPLFWSHHAFLDKVWAMWQDCYDYEKLEGASDILDAKAYEATRKNIDEIDVPMPFYFPDEHVEDCKKSLKACTETTSDQLPAYVTGRTPLDVHNVESVGYIYAPDDYDKRVKRELEEVCRFETTRDDVERRNLQTETTSSGLDDGIAHSARLKEIASHLLGTRESEEDVEQIEADARESVNVFFETMRSLSSTPAAVTRARKNECTHISAGNRGEHEHIISLEFYQRWFVLATKSEWEEMVHAGSSSPLNDVCVDVSERLTTRAEAESELSAIVVDDAEIRNIVRVLEQRVSTIEARDATDNSPCTSPCEEEATVLHEGITPKIVDTLDDRVEETATPEIVDDIPS